MAIKLQISDAHLNSTSTNLPNRNSPLSLTCWVNSPAWGQFTQSIVGTYLAGTTGIQIGSRFTDPGVFVWTWGGAIIVSTNGLYTPPINQWIHIGYVWDGTYNMIYIDGVLIATSTTAPVSGVLDAIYINGYPTGGENETSDSVVDDVAFYNRVLSPEEMMTISTSRGATDAISNGLLARYRFNELPIDSSVVAVADLSGNGNTLIPSGSGIAPTYAVGYADLDARPVLG